MFLAVGLILAACGDDDDTDTTDGESSEADASQADTTGETDDAASPDGAVTIEHAFGETVIDEVPERIVSLGSQWNGILLEMGAPLVGYIDDGYSDDPIYPWEEGLMPSDAEVLATANGLPYEQIAALQPDLIVVTFAITDQAGYDALAAIADTIPKLGAATEQVDTWQQLTTVAGQFMRDEAGAQEIVDNYDAMVDDLAEDLPGLAGKTYSFANYVPGDSIYVVADPEDGSSKFFTDLGMVIAPEILDAADGVSGRAQFSLEQVELLEADLLLILTNGADTADIVGFDQLAAVQNDAWASANYSMAVAMNTPSALSLAWAVDQIRPVLEAAAT